MILDNEEVSVINRTDTKMRVTLIVETEYHTYTLDTKEWRIYDDFSYPKKRKIRILLDDINEGE